ncbi:unnamed protein product [Brassica rapa subsp. narinosa]
MHPDLQTQDTSDLTGHLQTQAPTVMYNSSNVSKPCPRKYENAPEPFRLSSPHQASSTSRDTADPKTYTTATDQHGKENQDGLLNTTESFPLSPSENIDQTAKNEDILASWDDDDDV